jgi:hypothetical protein
MVAGNPIRHAGYTETRFTYLDIPGLTKIVRQFGETQSVTFQIGGVELAGDLESVANAYNSMAVEIVDVEPIQFTKTETGLDGIVEITRQAEPRVIWHPHRAPCLSVSLGQSPNVHNHALPSDVANRMAPLVKQWVELNYDVLVKFCQDGLSWTREQVNAHFDFQLRELT